MTWEEFFHYALGTEVVADDLLDWQPPAHPVHDLSMRTGVQPERIWAMTLAGYVPWLIDTLDVNDATCLNTYATQYQTLLRRHTHAIEVAVPGCATLACHVGFVVSRYESSNHPPPSESSATATPAPERTRLASDHFDGRWVVKWRGSGERPCKLPNGAYSGTYAFVVKNGTASAQLHSGALSGRIAADGSGAWRTLAMTDGAPIRTVGRFIGNNGSGTITRLDGKCTASFTARRVGRSERNAEASAPASSGTFLRSDGAPNCGPHVAGGRYCRNASGQVCYKGLTGSLGRCF